MLAHEYNIYFYTYIGTYAVCILLPANSLTTFLFLIHHPLLSLPSPSPSLPVLCFLPNTMPPHCRWASTGLEFMTVACAPTTLASIPQKEYEKVKILMKKCVMHVIGEAPATTAVTGQSVQLYVMISLTYSVLFTKHIGQIVS